MILGFKQFFPWGEPTQFQEKILAGIEAEINIMSGRYFYTRYGKEGDQAWPGVLPSKRFTPKLHTFRKGDRWKEGDKIHMAYGVRSNKYFQFNAMFPELHKVKSVQKVNIHWIEVDFEGKKYRAPWITIDDKPMLASIEVIATNDGFNSVDQFLRWFNKDFSGQIIHWTDLRY